MASFSTSGLLGIWERGHDLHAIDRALVMLAADSPEASADALASLSLGERDARLFALRERTFGPDLSGLADCAGCGGRMEFSVKTTDLRPDVPVQVPEPPEIESGGMRLSFRPINSYDLAAIVDCDGPDAARRILAQRLLGVADQPSPELIDRVAEAIAPFASDTVLRLTCPECGRVSDLDFDIATFLWTELAAEAARLLREVHSLAQAYGWREADILGMSAARRHVYLELVS